MIIKRRASESPSFQFEDVYKPNQLFCYGYGKKIKVEETIRADQTETIPDDLAKVADPQFFPQELYFRSVSDSFLKQCANIITACGGSPTIKHGAEFIRILTLDAGKGRSRMFIRNDKPVYISPRIDVGQSISKIKIVSPFPHVPTKPDGSKFRARVPGRGMIILDVYF